MRGGELDGDELSRCLMDGSADCIKVLDPTGRLVYVNAPGLKLLQVDDPGALTGRAWADLWPEAARDQVRAAAAAAAAGRCHRFQAACPTARGVLRWWDVAVSPVRDRPGGPVTRLLAVSRDITESREADRRKDEFLATLAHELRNPLAPMRIGVHTLALATDDRDALEQVRAMMARQLTHLARLIDDLMDASRIGRGRVELRRGPAELGAIVRQAVEASRPRIDAAGHALTLQLPAGPVPLEADAARLTQVVSNLLDNAAKYTDPGGRIHLAARREGAEAVVAVRDNGVGLSAVALGRVFDMFTQVDTSLGRCQGGLGIGLALARTLAELHGGRLTAASDGPGRGSVFTLRLPLEQVPEPSPVPVPEPGPPVAVPAGRRVLLADDNADAVESLARFLGLLGNRVRTAPDGQAAVDAAAEFGPEVVILDIGMPRLDGYEACRRIRALPGGRDALLVALTGWGQPDDRRRSREAGFDLHLVKPVEPDELERLLAAPPRPRPDAVS